VATVTEREMNVRFCIISIVNIASAKQRNNSKSSAVPPYTSVHTKCSTCSQVAKQTDPARLVSAHPHHHTSHGIAAYLGVHDANTFAAQDPAEPKCAHTSRHPRCHVVDRCRNVCDGGARGGARSRIHNGLGSRDVCNRV
jgi:hypothetical protein